jgi:hypothetical protein
MTETRLNRTGGRPLVFRGVEVASVNTKQAGDTRWSKAMVYRAENGVVVLGHAKMTNWQGEKDHFDAKQVDNAGALVAFLEREDPACAEKIARQLNVVEKIK